MARGLVSTPRASEMMGHDAERTNKHNEDLGATLIFVSHFVSSHDSRRLSHSKDRTVPRSQLRLCRPVPGASARLWRTVRSLSSGQSPRPRTIRFPGRGPCCFFGLERSLSRDHHDSELLACQLVAAPFGRIRRVAGQTVVKRMSPSCLWIDHRSLR